MTSRGARTARGAAIAAFAVFAASLAHTVGGGRPPGLLAVVLAMAFATPVAMILVGRRMRLRGTVVSALVAQSALHLFYALGSPGASASGTPVGAHALHSGAAIRIDGVIALDHGHAGMPVAHVVAAVLTVAFLAVLERAAALVSVVADLAGRGIRLLQAVLVGLPVPDMPGRARTTDRSDGPSGLGIRILSSLRHRGPPAGAATA
ncbi:hypothetical protein [Agromyces marinus]|uniref:Integral membrane protein n=1 Tax=Agromyces marinus TaxID=1389020 RepID=A0ABN6YDC6_9MICO|nr:hypothetical protein [Agromyces marinus]UIP59559.1 hypothetical protein DSM26151_24700 [Agromyces marinus]BDZ55384.1 hypothetical protein GCM10025870_24570 [Agromyces marinus]